MKAFIAKSAWAEEEDYRLDARRYAEGALAARSRIIDGPFAWLPLERVARIFRGPLHKRHFIRDKARSVPYLAASDVTRIDLPSDMRLSNALTPVLPILRVKSGWTLISSAGTIGDATYVRDELTKFAISQDMLRVAPFDNILSGYLFAYLSTKAARALLRFRTYGSVVDRIEPQHVADLPVPLPESTMQYRLHNLVVRAAQARTAASELLGEATAYLDSLIGPMPSTHDHSFALGITHCSQLNMRLDAFHHVGWATEGGSYSGTPIGELGQVTRPGIIKRIFVERGVPFISGIDAFQLRVPFRQYIMRSEAAKSGDLIKEHQILVQRSGQRYGLIGRPAYVGSRMNGWAASEHLMRITLSNDRDVARVFAFLCSESGHRTLLRSSYGTSIPELNPEGLAAIKVPQMPDRLIVNVAAALALREQSDLDEELAIREVEQWVNSSH
jgi:type I restriction enzyme, S subunit